MTVNFLIKDSLKDSATVYVNSTLFSGGQLECDDGTASVCIKAVENKLLYNMGFSNVIKTLLSMFLYGESEYYAPYRRVYECTVDPQKHTDVIIESINGEITFKDRNGKALDSRKTVEISKKKMWQYAFLSGFRLVYVLAILLYASNVAIGIPAFCGSFLFYLCMIFAAGFVVYTFYDVFSVLIHSIRYYRNSNLNG